MTEDPAKSDPLNSASHGDTFENVEWELADLVDAIAAEIDRAQDTLSLKSYARGVSFAIKKLSLDIEVKARRTSDGKLLFRTVNADQTSGTVLKLDFAQVLQNQLQGVRKPLDGDISVAGLSGVELTDLPDISTNDIQAFRTVGIYSVDDLERYTQTPKMIAELSRKTGIQEHRIRMWRQLPFITEVKLDSSTPDRTVIRIKGGNFGSQPQLNSEVFFQQKPTKIIAGGDTWLTVEMPPEVSGTGLLWAKIGEQFTNTISWKLTPVDLEALEATTIDLWVRDIIVSPANPIEGQEIEVTADLINQGNIDSGFFEVQWEIDGQKQETQLHGLLRSQQKSEDSTIRRQFKLNAGEHIIRFTVDPKSNLPDINKTKGTISKQIVVRDSHAFRPFNWHRR